MHLRPVPALAGSLLPGAVVAVLLGSIAPDVVAAPARPLESPAATAPFAIAHVTIVDPEDGTRRPDATVLVRDGRIASIGAAGEAAPRGIPIVNGRGRFLIPGLWDMHVHLSWTTSSALPILVANGVTGVRDCGSDLAEIDAWRAEIAARARVGPRIVRAGPMLNGKSFNRFQLATGGPERARGEVAALKQVGVDFIKVHRRVPRDDYFAIVDEARKQGLPLVGHIPMSVSPEEASDAGQLIEHTETLFEGTFSAGLTFAQLPDSIRSFRAHGADSLFARFVRNHTTVTPTLAVWRYLAEHPDSSWMLDPQIRYVARSLQETVRRAPPPFSTEQWPMLKRLYAEYSSVVGQMSEAGVTLLAGTDVAGTRIPGFLLHDELEALVEAGLTPLQALRAATVNPAKVLGRAGDFGRVAAGRVADLVLLDADPLVDIRNTRRIAAVVLDGRLLSRADLDALLRAGAEMASRN